MNSRIKKDLQELLDQKVIDPEIAQSIETYYVDKQAKNPNRLMTIFGILGSALVGLGIILIVAHNWDDFTKPLKTFFAFLPLIIGQVAVAFSLFRNKGPAWLEGSGTFLYFAVGAAISLVSQIYNIPGKVHTFMFSWILLCAPLIYLLRSRIILLLHIVFSTYYAIDLGYGFLSSSSVPWWYLLFMAIPLPFYINLMRKERQSNMISIIIWLYPLSFVICLGTFAVDDEIWMTAVYTLLFTSFYAIGRMQYFSDQKLRRNGYLIIGSLGVIFMLLMHSFKFLWKDYFRDPVEGHTEIIAGAVLFIISAGIFAYNRATRTERGFNLFEYVFVLFPLIILCGIYEFNIGMVLVNLLVLALGLQAIKIGNDRMHFGILNYGLIIITALVGCRFFDTDMSFILRGLLFVGVGAGFFLANYFMVKKQKQLK